MIFSSVFTKEDVYYYPEGIRMALKYIMENDFLSMEPGKYEINGEDIYAIVMDIETTPIETKRPETHKDYIDVQFVVRGTEKLV